MGRRGFILEENWVGCEAGVTRGLRIRGQAQGQEAGRREGPPAGPEARLVGRGGADNGGACERQ